MMLTRFVINRSTVVLIVAALTASLAMPAMCADGQGTAEPSAQEVRAQYEAKRLVSKQAYHFDQWPGKGGKVRPGVDIGKALAGVLPQLRCISASASAEGSDYSPGNRSGVRWLASDVTIDIRVFASCDDAQASVLDDLTFRTNAAIDSMGTDLGVDLGDVSFPGPKATQFVRSNVEVEVRSRAGDALHLAQLVDQAILARPAFDTYEQMAAYRPRIKTLRFRDSLSQPVHLEGRAHSAARFPLIVEAVDPERGPVHLSWSGTPGMGVLEAKDAKGYTHELSAELFTTDHAVQDRNIVLTAVNECGIFSTATLPLRVTVTTGTRTWADGTLVKE